jgi:type 2 lantibiotic biosynthesis protein LanM
MVATVLKNWEACCLEFLQRFCADWSQIRNVFSPAQDPGALAGVRSNAGDYHRGGRSVWILEFSSGLKIVYKPKPMAVDQHFQEFLGWLNQRGLSAPFRQLAIVDCGTYGWEEFIRPEACSSREEVASFYRRTGGYVAVLYALAATDFHHENILAAGEHPVLIDLEALFHPSGLEVTPQQAADLAERSFGESVLGSGLLPVPVWGGRETGIFDLSGLGAEAGRKIPMRAPGWNCEGTDEMHFARQTLVVDSADHRPTLNGNTTTPLDYLDEIESGFQQVYRLLEKHRGELLAPGGLIDRFANDEVRVVLRSSSVYAELLQEGSHPDVLRDGLDRDRLFDRLWEEINDRPQMAQLIPAEVEDLWRGDIPLFTTRPGSRDLWASADRHFPAMLNESGLDRARQRLAQLGDEDLKRQLWFLRGSLTTLASAARPASRSRGQSLAEPTVPFDGTQFLAASCAIGDRLAETALHGTNDVTWIGLNLVRQTQWILVPLGLDFYDGISGITLFLAYLGSVSTKERYAALARAALETVRRRVDRGTREKGFGEIGGFVGWGGLLYLLAHLGVLWDEPALLSEAHELVDGLPERIGKDKDLDIICGAAGCILALLCVHTCRRSARVLEIARQCGEHLLANARQMPHGLGWVPAFSNHGPLTGFSHGAAGISLALLQLAAHTGDERFRTAAIRGISYERSLFSAQAGNWPDLRSPDINSAEAANGTLPFPVAWCHGAPGIGLARLLSRQFLDDSLFEEEIEIALHTTMTSGFGHNHSLCHGDLGNLELLREAAQAWPASSWREQADRVASGVLCSIRSDGWLCGNPLQVESPGLMTGLAGIGYGLLRCAEPARVPSVLSLAAPFPTVGCATQFVGAGNNGHLA